MGAVSMKLDDTHSARHGARPSHHEATSDDTSIFDVVWNSDLSLHCQAINKTLRLEQNGVRANADQAWFGDAIATLYGAGVAMPSAAGPNGSLINNGIPQLADRDLIKNATARRNCNVALVNLAAVERGRTRQNRRINVFVSVHRLLCCTEASRDDACAD